MKPLECPKGSRRAHFRAIFWLLVSDHSGTCKITFTAHLPSTLLVEFKKKKVLVGLGVKTFHTERTRFCQNAAQILTRKCMHVHTNR